MTGEPRPALKLRNIWRDLIIVIIVTSLGTLALLQVDAFELMRQLFPRHGAWDPEVLWRFPASRRSIPRLSALTI